ncbi:hypothetical protein CC2G_012408 [Coprinopsis cinerea AmutBmut pab1-1]|nr:hypothetical protein CC2G_012408 [Coprinopsis cinerea AmutBmut pab1-1]
MITFTATTTTLPPSPRLVGDRDLVCTGSAFCPTVKCDSEDAVPFWSHGGIAGTSLLAIHEQISFTKVMDPDTGGRMRFCPLTIVIDGTTNGPPNCRSRHHHDPLKDLGYLNSPILSDQTGENNEYTLPLKADKRRNNTKKNNRFRSCLGN